MAFENVNVISLKNSINNCINSIDYSSSKEIINQISSNDVWSTESKKNFARALNKLIYIRYSELEKKLQNYLKMADKIEEYQKLSATNSASQLELENLINELNNSVNESDTSEFNDKISNINKEINNNDIKLTTIKNSLEDLI